MKLITNAARRGTLIAFGHTLRAGESVLMTEAAAAQLAADPHVQVTVEDDPNKAAPGEGHDHESTLEPKE
jgi:hypothetical protein